MKEGVGIRRKYKKVIVLVMMLFFALLGGCKPKETKIANDYEETKKAELNSQENVKKEENAAEVTSQGEKQNTAMAEQSVSQEEQKQAMTKEPKENKVKEQHSHIWFPICGTVIHEATGHYETKVVEEVYAWRTFCNKCGEDITDLGVEGITIHSAVLCESGYHNDYVVIETKTEQVWIEDTPAHAETIIEGYYCDCGARKTK